MEIIKQYPFIISFICAELFLCIARSQKITIILKKETQRTEAENREAQNGLRCSILLEALLFVPASVGLFLLTVSPLISGRFPQIKSNSLWYAYYGLVGVAAYGFPFSAIRQIIKRLALIALREFAQITAENDNPEVATNGDKEKC